MGGNSQCTAAGLCSSSRNDFHSNSHFAQLVRSLPQSCSVKMARCYFNLDEPDHALKGAIAGAATMLHPALRLPQQRR